MEDLSQRRHSRNDTPNCIEPMTEPENDRPGLFS
jgi:hypothetical protein